MLAGYNLTWLRLEFGTDLATPGTVFEGFSPPRCPLDRRNILPSLVVARSISMMHCIEDAKLSLPRGVEDLQHIRNAAIRLRDSPNAVPELAAFGNEIVIGIDYQKCSKLRVVCQLRHRLAQVLPVIGIAIWSIRIMEVDNSIADSRMEYPTHQVRKRVGRWSNKRRLKALWFALGICPLCPRKRTYAVH